MFIEINDLSDARVRIFRFVYLNQIKTSMYLLRKEKTGREKTSTKWEVQGNTRIFSVIISRREELVQ